MPILFGICVDVRVVVSCAAIVVPETEYLDIFEREFTESHPSSIYSLEIESHAVLRSSVVPANGTIELVNWVPVEYVVSLVREMTLKTPWVLIINLFVPMFLTSHTE